MPTVVEELPDPPNPVDALDWVRHLPYPLLLESAARHPEIGRYSFVTADPFALLRSRGREVTLTRGGAARRSSGDPLEALRSVLAEWEVSSVPGLPPFQAGAAGYLGYDLCRILEEIPDHRFDDLRLPDLCLGFYDWVIAWDHEAGGCFLLSTGLPDRGGAAAHRARGRSAQVREWLAAGAPTRGTRRREPPGPTPPVHPVPGLPGVRSTFSRGEYLDTVQRVREYILAGDIFQANLTQRLQTPLPVPPHRLYRKLRDRNPAPYASYFDCGEAVLVGSSPELFLRLRGRSVETRPIKGTAPRSPVPDRDRALAEALAASEKDLAENVMIVDLLRNDLSIVCTDDSVLVPRLREVESHSSVHHLVSTIVGELREGMGPVDLIRASFPGGSITGAPKIRAMEIIAELEPTCRGPYTGSVGYIGFDGTMELNIVIRTFVVAGDTAYFQVGGGIVLDSEPAREYQETLDKARGLLDALEVS